MQPTEHRYRGECGQRYHESKRAIPEVAWPWVARVRAKKIALHLSASAVALEYGVGLGWNLAALRCARRIGYDIGEFLAIPVRAQGIEFVSETHSLGDESIDVVICHHVLEHLLNPPEALEEIRRLLRPAGRLLVFAPYEKERRYRAFRQNEPNHHLYSWNVQTLGSLVEECGLEVEKGAVGMFSYDRFSAVWAVRLGCGERGYRFIRQLVHWVYPCQEIRIVARKRGEQF